MIVGQIQKGEKMGRTLNEDDVLKEIDRWIGYLDEDMITRIKIGIKKLQSAQPEQHEDAVSREAVYTVIEEVLYETTKGADNWYGLLNDGVRTLPPVTPKQRWIPCSERLPDYRVSVLTWDGYCYCVEKRIPYIRDEDGELISSDWWVSDEYDEYESDYYPNLRDGACIAWYELPEPYREEGGE